MRPLPPRSTLFPCTTLFRSVFDRGGFSPKLFQQIITTGFDLLTYRKGRYVLELSPEALDNTFKLTETSYVTASIADSPWAVRLREDIRLARTVLFVGYSLYDLDVRRVLSDNPKLREKCFFVVAASRSEER